MYNLIVGAVDGSLGIDRMLESADAGTLTLLRPGGFVDTGRLLALPTLVMPEIGDQSPQFARVGRIVSLSQSGREWRFQFVPNSKLPQIPSARIEAAAHALSIGEWDFRRTRWTVRSADLYGALFAEGIIGLPEPTAFDLPLTGPRADTVAVMMPFGAAFNDVWAAIRGSAEAGGWSCQRADDIWEASAIINDVVALIARAKVVVCDLTGRNANVFYEAGIAHTLGREVVLITQSQDDVPFDLKHHRYIHYLGNAEGLEALKVKLAARLRTLMAR